MHIARVVAAPCVTWLFLSIAACGGGGAPSGSDGGADGAARCASNLDCSDDVFCNGIERCAPTAADADARGCVRGQVPCMSGQTCNERDAVCETICSVTRDADADGAVAISCGGTDCDDADANRYPGNTEVCDATGHDEDCDRFTIGDRDADHDGAIDAACCNAQPGSTPVCGTDCDDAMASTHPGATEACNARDDDCDTGIDEGVSRTFWPDGDHDGYGASLGMPVHACAPSVGLAENPLDCDDTDASIAPGHSDTCNLHDDDCDGTVDEAAETSATCAARYGTPPDTLWSCVMGTCTVGCDATHADCDGEPSNGCEADLTTDANHCGACGNQCGIGGECLSAGGTPRCDQVSDVEVGEYFTCAVRQPSGRVVCWGRNDVGQLGNGTFSRALGYSPPTVVRDLEGVVALGLKHGYPPAGDAPAFACAQTPSAIVCWGGEDLGQLGDGMQRGFRAIPSPVPGAPRFDIGIASVLGLSVGTERTCIAYSPAVSGTTQYGVDCWGSNQSGSIVGGGAGFYASPTPFVGSNVGRFSMLVATGRSLNCAFYTTLRTTTDTLVCQGTLAGTWTGGSYEELTAGHDFMCARSGGQVYCMGNNSYGQLGVGDTTARTSPTLVPGITDAVRVVAGPATACAIHADGTVSCWGNNMFAQMGLGTRTGGSPSPVRSPLLTSVSDLSLSFEHACAVRTNGDVLCWGDNANGQCGAVTSNSPTVIPEL